MGAVVALTVMLILLFVCDVSMLRECEGTALLVRGPEEV